MPKYLTFDENGHVQTVGQGSFVPTDAVTLPDGVDKTELFKYMLVERPLSPTIETLGTTHTIAGCPAGTEIEVLEYLGDEQILHYVVEVESEDVVFTLTDPGSYEITVRAPMPCLPTTKGVTVG